MKESEASKLGTRLGESLADRGLGINKDGELKIRDYEKLRRRLVVEFYESILEG